MHAGVLLQPAAPADSPGVWHARLLCYTELVIRQSSHGRSPVPGMLSKKHSYQVPRSNLWVLTGSRQALCDDCRERGGVRAEVLLR